jgi:hypothetical protein
MTNRCLTLCRAGPSGPVIATASEDAALQSEFSDDEPLSHPL